MFKRIISVLFVSIVACTAFACAPKAEVAGDYPPPTPPATKPADDNPGAPAAEPAHYAPASKEANLGISGGKEQGAPEHSDDVTDKVIEGQEGKVVEGQEGKVVEGQEGQVVEGQEERKKS